MGRSVQLSEQTGEQEVVGHMGGKRLGASDVESYFTKAATTFDSFYDGRRSAFMQAVDRRFRSDMFERFRLTFERLSPMEGRTVLDVGCGSGVYVVEALHRGAATVVGLDAAPTMIELARQRVVQTDAADRCELVVGTFPEDAPAETFDYAVVMGVMDYIADPEAFLKGLFDRVKTRAVLSFPSRHWLRSPLREVRYKMKHCPLYLFESEEAKRLVEEAGFQARVEKIAGAGMDYVVTGERPGSK